ncbi:MAG TPA: molybdopterin cofactor-binding domain-containing protein [Stellaceae bacterium]|nr:molybdopterin cofactor-binding domain-containing protein [Stellaceae bacterium]
MDTIDRSANDATLNRRSFLVGSVATGLAFGYSAVPGLAAAPTAGDFEPTVWYTIAPNGTVTVIVGKSEMGQHVSSAMAQLIAEELEADWKDVRISFPTNDPKYNDPVLGALITGGSWSVHYNFDAMSRAGAAGRITLIEAAGEMLHVPASELRAQNSRVHHDKSNKSVSYAQIVAGGKARKVWSPDELKAITLKTREQRTLVGRSVPQLDVPPKTNGTAVYGIDVFLPGMAYGKLALPPVRYGATVKSVDDSAAKKVPGFLKAVVLEDKTQTITGWVAAIATTYEGAMQAADALKIDWDKGPNAGVSSDSILAEAKRLQQEPGAGLYFVKTGDAAGAMAKAAKVLELDYTTSINCHCTMEPMNAAAMQQGDTWHVYLGNQFQTRTGAITAAALGVDPKQVILHQQFLGGGFGRRLDGDMAVAAALAAKGAGRPVKLIYSRADDITMDFGRPLTYQKLKLGLGADGKPVAWEHDVVCAWPTARWNIPAFLSPSVDKKGSLDGFTVNGADHWYTVPNHSVRAILNELAQKATPSGQLRSVAPGWTFWAIESAIDEMAHAAGVDPVAYRLALLDGAGANAGGAQRLADALHTAVGRSGYGAVPLAKGEGMGVACVSSQERATASWTACVAHVAVAADGTVKVKKLTVVSDIGTAVNPDGARAQVEGAALWGLSIALFEQATLRDGGIEQTNFDGYTPLRMADLPELDVSIIANGQPATGTGEPATTVVGPAIANAVFNAVGARVRSLPITADAVKAAMKS